MVQIEQIYPSLTWRIRQETMYPDQSLDFVKLEDDFDGIHFGLYVNHHLTGVVSLFQNEHNYQFRKLAILPHQQGKGFGTALLNYILNFCKIQNATSIWCNARVNAKEFYAKFDFSEMNQTFTKNEIHYLIMELQF
ncbi:GNAT family N-acetyltransferase [Pedobacter changchengzhani]|uniref:GNAT family N-acetyltransferase n=1 Tax=Pedobacter changchengzhani TaxID=2529274 RepID=A0A4R5MM57_9SPHI|nr:GNAT family N-acetyltransferase [Pedobacter changchengzhani]TDG36742.1 GNAT family N-acetyltransferase [Pedobacter changchengzhani]